MYIFFNLFWKVCLNFFDSIYSVLFILFLIWNKMMCQVIGLWLSSYPPFSFRRFTKLTTYIIQFNSAAQSCSTLCTRPPCPSPTPGVYPNSCPLSRWYHPTTSILCHPLLPPSIFPSIRVFSNESALRIRWPLANIPYRLALVSNCPLHQHVATQGINPYKY